MINPKHKVLRALGVFLVVLACVAGFLWFYWLAPWRHLHSPRWVESHSLRERWNEAQKQLVRTGVDHDSSIDVGYYGDEKWTEWTIRKVSGSTEPLGSCGEGLCHLPDALNDLTNQRVSNSPAGWSAWWAANKNKTQVEWIRDDFTQRGIVLHDPLTTNDMIALIEVTNSGAFRYNARRWLRDSGVTPTTVRLDSVPPERREALARKLIDYAQWYGENWNAPGSLRIKTDYDYDHYGWTSIMDHIPCNLIVGVIIAVLMGSGMVLFRRSISKTTPG